ncbi:MAG: ABC transporter ATP-binding protein [Deinococcales bacterium]
MSGGTVLFEARHVTKRYGGLVAVSDVSFQHREGEILGLIGPNGAGKTTLINLISGTQEPTSGALLFEGKPLRGLAPYRRAHLGIGRTFQIMKPFPGLSVLDNVTAGALFGREPERAMPPARDAAARWLAFVGLADKAQQPAEALGGPDRKRLELAKALALQPRLVVDLIRRIRDSGTTILVIEHVVKAIRELSDRLLVLQYGQLIAEGTADEVLDDPRVIEAYLGRRRH